MWRLHDSCRGSLLPMLRRGLLALAAWCSGCPLPQPVVAVDPDELRPAVVRVGDGCSGVCISPDGLVLTARHCLTREGEQTDVAFDSAGTWTGRVVHLCPTSDLAVVQIEARPSRSVKLALSGPPGDGGADSPRGRLLPSPLTPAARDAFPGAGFALPSSRVLFDGTGTSTSAPAPRTCRPLATPAAHWPWAPVATAAPQPRDEVFSLTYPHGHFAQMEGTVRGVGEATFFDVHEPRSPLDLLRPIRGERFPCIETDFIALPGSSGGPLFNQQGEVVGICSRGPVSTRAVPHTFWVHTSELQRAVQDAGARRPVPREPVAEPADPAPRTARPLLYVFVGEQCPACARFKTDFADGRSAFGRQLVNRFEVRLLDVHAEAQLARQYQVESIPTFVVAATGVKVIGYRTSDQTTLIARLTGPVAPAPAGSNESSVPGAFQRGSVPVDLGEPSSPARPPASSPSGAASIIRPAASGTSKLESQSSPAASASSAAGSDSVAGVAETPDAGTFDWSTARVFVLIKLPPGDATTSALVGGVERWLDQPDGPGRRFRRWFNDQTGGRADLTLVDERLHPQRFSQLKKISGVPDQPLTAVVLIRKQYQGLRSLVEAAVTSMFKKYKDRQFAGMALEIVFEQTDPADYEAAVAAADLDDAASAPPPTRMEELVLIVLVAVWHLWDGYRGGTKKRGGPSSTSLAPGLELPPQPAQTPAATHI